MNDNAMVVRPVNGSRRLRRVASIRLDGGAIVATDRRGRSRKFPIDGSDDSPGGFQYTRDMSDGGYYLEDRRGRSLVRLDGMNWDTDQLSALEDAAGLSVRSDPGSASPDPGMMTIQDPPYFSRASVSASIGMGAMALYWLHIAPEAVVNFLALPALVVCVYFIVVLKLSMPNKKEIAAMQKRADALSAETEAKADEILKRYGIDPAAEPEGDKP